MARNFTLSLSPSAWIGDSVGVLVAGDIAAIPGNFSTPNQPYLEFKDGADESAAVTESFIMPDEYTGTDTLKLKIAWCSATGDNTKKVDWEVYVEAITDGDGKALNAARGFDAANASNPTVEAVAYHEIVTVITLANKDGVAAGDIVTLGLRRDSDDANDDAASSSYVVAVELYEE